MNSLKQFSEIEGWVLFKDFDIVASFTYGSYKNIEEKLLFIKDMRRNVLSLIFEKELID